MGWETLKTAIEVVGIIGDERIEEMGARVAARLDAIQPTGTETGIRDSLCPRTPHNSRSSFLRISLLNPRSHNR